MEIEIVEKNKLSTYDKMADFFNKEMKKKKDSAITPLIYTLHVQDAGATVRGPR